MRDKNSLNLLKVLSLMAYLKLLKGICGCLFRMTSWKFFYNKRIAAGVAIISFISGHALAQEQKEDGLQKKEKATGKTIANAADSVEVDIFCYVAEDMPTFMGKEPSITLREFLAKNLHYPKSGIRDGIEGIVYVSFKIDTLGLVKNVNVVRGINPDFDAEAVRVIKSMPPWSAGKFRGKKVDVPYTFPVKFKLSKESDK